jgi:hypothetical protein
MEPELGYEHNDVHTQCSNCVERWPRVPEEYKAEDGNNGGSNRQPSPQIGRNKHTEEA